jgi:hypothetical protein
LHLLRCLSRSALRFLGGLFRRFLSLLRSFSCGILCLLGSLSRCLLGLLGYLVYRIFNPLLLGYLLERVLYGLVGGDQLL